MRRSTGEPAAAWDVAATRRYSRISAVLFFGRKLPVPERSIPLVMMEALAPLRESLDDPRFRGPVILLVGATAGLLQAYLQLVDPDPLPREYIGSGVLDELRDTLSASGFLPWQGKPNLRLFLLGHFLNSGQQRLAAAVDTWLSLCWATVHGYDVEDVRVEDRWVGTIPGISAGHLRRECTGVGLHEDVCRRLHALEYAFQEYFDTGAAAAYLAKPSEVLSVDQTYDADEPSPAEAVALTCARVNTVKHRFRGTYDRFEVGYVREFSAAAKGVVYLAELCAQMIQQWTKIEYAGQQKKGPYE